MGCTNYERSQQQSLSSVPKVGIVERFKCIQKYLGSLKALLNLQFLIVSFQAEENTKD